MIWFKGNKAPAINVESIFHFKSYNKIESVNQDLLQRESSAGFTSWVKRGRNPLVMNLWTPSSFLSSSNTQVPHCPHLRGSYVPVRVTLLKEQVACFPSVPLKTAYFRRDLLRQITNISRLLPLHEQTSLGFCTKFWLNRTRKTPTCLFITLTLTISKKKIWSFTTYKVTQRKTRLILISKFI